MNKAPNYGIEPSDFDAYCEALYAAKPGAERDAVDAAFPVIARTTVAAANRAGAAFVDFGRAFVAILPTPLTKLLSR